MALRCDGCGKLKDHGRLDEAAVERVLALREEGWTQVALAAEFSEARATIRKVLAGGDDRLCRSCGTKEKWEAPTPGMVAHKAEFTRAGSAARRGRKLSPEHREKLRAARAGGRPASGLDHSITTRILIAAAHVGRKRSTATRHALSLGQHRRYGTTPNPNKPTRRDLARWAYEVIRRDGGACVVCGHRKQGRKDVAAHHILSRARHPELALLVNNGVTLCRPCHDDEHRVNGVL